MGCSSFRAGDFVGRSFDFYYDNNPSIIVKTKHTSDHLASIGVAGGGVGNDSDSLTQKNITNNTVGKNYRKLLPFMLVDGINENHVYINQNVLTPDTKYGITSGTNPGKPRCCINFFLKTILDKATSAKNAVKICYDYDLYSIKSETFHYETHYMICDLENTYIVEFNNNEVVYYGPEAVSGVESGYKGTLAHPVMTNFYISGWNGTIPQLPTPSLDEEDTNGLLRYSCGVERYKILMDGLDTVEDLESAKALINQVKYTQTYSNALGQDFWYTELTGDWVTIATPHNNPELVSFINAAKARFNEKKRGRDASKPGQGLWISNHQCAYDLRNLKLVVEPQESGEEYEYSL